jgi:hypothetical protein
MCQPEQEETNEYRRISEKLFRALSYGLLLLDVPRAEIQMLPVVV